MQDYFEMAQEKTVVRKVLLQSYMGKLFMGIVVKKLIANQKSDY